MSSRRKVNGESLSSSEEGGFIYRWRVKRAQKKLWKEIFVALEEHLDAGLPVSDFFVFQIDESVEWDREGGFWFVRVTSLAEMELEAGMKVGLSSGRGGAEETARIVEVLGDFVDMRSGNSGWIYKLEFER